MTKTQNRPTTWRLCRDCHNRTTHTLSPKLLLEPFSIIKIDQSTLSFYSKIFGGKKPFLTRGNDTPVLNFWWLLPWASKPGWIPRLPAFSPQIHLWCYTCCLSVYSGQHGNQTFSSHILVKRSKWKGLVQLPGNLLTRTAVKKINNSEAKESSCFTVISGKVLPIYHAFVFGILVGKDTPYFW